MTYHNNLTGSKKPCSLEKVLFSCLRKFSPMAMRICALPLGELTPEGEELASFFAGSHDLRHAARDALARYDAMQSASRRTWHGFEVDEPIETGRDFFNLLVSCNAARYGQLKLLISVYYNDAPVMPTAPASYMGARWWHWKY